MRLQAASSSSVFSLCLSCLLVAAPNAPDAQEDIVIGEKISIFSEILDEERIIRVGKPINYGQGDERYPVM